MFFECEKKWVFFVSKWQKSSKFRRFCDCTHWRSDGNDFIAIPSFAPELKEKNSDSDENNYIFAGAYSPIPHCHLRFDGRFALFAVFGWKCGCCCCCCFRWHCQWKSMAYIGISDFNSTSTIKRQVLTMNDNEINHGKWVPNNHDNWFLAALIIPSPGWNLDWKREIPFFYIFLIQFCIYFVFSISIWMNWKISVKRPPEIKW